MAITTGADWLAARRRVLMAAIGGGMVILALLSTTASFGAVFTGSGTNTGSGQNESLAASAEFLLTHSSPSQDTLTIVLRNTSTQTYSAALKAVPTDLLTGLFFDIVAPSVPTLVYQSAVPSAIIQSLTQPTDVKVVSRFSGLIGGWQYQSSTGDLPGTTESQGLGTVGLGVFSGNLVGDDNYGIINASYVANSNQGNPKVSSLPLIQDLLTFTFTLNSGLLSDLSKQISNVRFQYGSSMDAPGFPGNPPQLPPPPAPPTAPVPEPASMAVWALLGLIGLVAGRRCAAAK